MPELITIIGYIGLLIPIVFIVWGYRAYREHQRTNTTSTKKTKVPKKERGKPELKTTTNKKQKNWYKSFKEKLISLLKKYSVFPIFALPFIFVSISKHLPQITLIVLVIVAILCVVAYVIYENKIGRLYRTTYFIYCEKYPIKFELLQLLTILYR